MLPMAHRHKSRAEYRQLFCGCGIFHCTVQPEVLFETTPQATAKPATP